MQGIARVFIRLFKSVERVANRTGQGLIRHGAGKYGVNAVRRINISIPGMRVAYENLSEIDKAVVDEVVEYVTRDAFEYIDHHDDRTSYRLDTQSLEDAIMSHANEIFEAGKRALHARIRSHA